MIRFLLFILFFSLILSGVAQDGYRTDAVVIRLKEKFKGSAEQLRIADSGITFKLDQAGIKNVEKMFPHHRPVDIKSGDKNHVDLSMIYTAWLKSGVQIGKVLNTLQSSGYFEYAEVIPLPVPAYVPNDPLLTQQYAPGKMNCFAAWDINQGDTSVVIAITDTGVDMDHPDLAGNIKHNYNDPIDGIDNDGDGFIDNFSGWDLGENDNDPSSNVNHHGVHVTGIAAAVTDNSQGIVGIGFKSRFMPVKISNASGFLTHAYQGIVYAADHGARVINCSWGGTVGGQFGEDIINYATFNKNSLVVAAAGNNNDDFPFYPAAYKNVISVAGTDINDAKYNISNFGYWIHVSAPGSNIHSTWDGGNYSSSSGTSMAAPQVAGAAAIVMAQFPGYNALQIRERLRMTSDDITAQNPVSLAGKLGIGRVDLYDALTQTNVVAVNLVREVITDFRGDNFTPGDTVHTTLTFRNYLDPSPVLNAVVTSLSSYLTILDGQTTYPGMATLDTSNNQSDPFRFIVSPQTPKNTVATIKVSLTGTGYSDDIYLQVRLNTDFYNVTINDVHTTLTGIGRIGYYDTQQNTGLGFVYKNENLLYEGGVMIGSSLGRVSDAVRGVGGTSEDFYSYIPIYRSNTGASDLDLMNWFNDYGPTAGNGPLGIDVHHRGYAWNDPGSENFVIVRYLITNNGSQFAIIPDLYGGIFADWDILNYSQNTGATDTLNKLGYVFNSDSMDMYAGIKLLSPGGSFHHYVVDNLSSSGAVNTLDGLTTEEKYLMMSGNQHSAGTGFGTDVLHAVSAGPYSLAVGDTVEVCFAILASDSLSGLITASQEAQLKYDTEVPLQRKEHNFKEVSVFPNPAVSKIYIKGLESGNTYRFRLFDITGKQWLSKDLAGSGLEQVELSTVAPGIYFYEVSGQSESIITGKVLVLPFKD